MRGAARYLRADWRDLESFVRLLLSPEPGGVRESRTMCQPTDSELRTIRATLSRVLSSNILPFWYPNALDLDHGGYQANHDLHGRWLGPGDKGIVLQSRVLWFFSRLSRSSRGTPEHRAAATHGYQFIRDRMWDPEFGGFYWAVDPTGRAPSQPFKHLYGQVMALYALSEYATASGDPGARDLTARLFRTLEERAHDGRHGGYYEFFEQDWAPAASDRVNPMGSQISSGMKTTNAHLHCMEAVTGYVRASDDPIGRERLLELMSIMTTTTLLGKVAAYGRVYREDWTLVHLPGRDRVSYGHDVETVWLLMEASKATGRRDALLLNLYRAVFANAIRYGFDREAGGFYTEGLPWRAADNRLKLWWVQGEALISALKMFTLTGERTYFRCFERTLDWIVTAQADWTGGEWFAEVLGRRPRGIKAGPWKGPYHHGRATLECLELLDARLATAGAPPRGAVTEAGMA
ncbi:MAG: AGE family epimerase/isomerase [Chloroflexi bacterium]|nr:AGE family epimerase/isomerase [Chloroflexota bacterium]